MTAVLRVWRLHRQNLGQPNPRPGAPWKVLTGANRMSRSIRFPVFGEIIAVGGECALNPDLPTGVFQALRARFFDDGGRSIPFSLREKRNTQDDPFDEMLATVALTDLPGVTCDKASGPLITPDMVLYRPELCAGVTASHLQDDLDRIVGLEVKKLERTAQGTVARASGLDYNTTPPCGRIRVYDRGGSPLDIRGFYLFVCVESAAGGQVAVTAMALVDGNLLNADFEYYLGIVGQRQKTIGLGTYGDGADRSRPMVIFANPLGIPQLSRGACLVHPSSSLERAGGDLRRVSEIHRTAKNGETLSFSCYRHSSDVTPGSAPEVLVDPFRTPSRRTAQTSARGRFRLSLQL